MSSPQKGDFVAIVNQLNLALQRGDKEGIPVIDVETINLAAAEICKLRQALFTIYHYVTRNPKNIDGMVKKVTELAGGILMLDENGKPQVQQEEPTPPPMEPAPEDDNVPV